MNIDQLKQEFSEIDPEQGQALIKAYLDSMSHEERWALVRELLTDIERGDIVGMIKGYLKTHRVTIEGGTQIEGYIRLLGGTP